MAHDSNFHNLTHEYKRSEFSLRRPRMNQMSNKEELRRAYKQLNEVEERIRKLEELPSNAAILWGAYECEDPGDFNHERAGSDRTEQWEYAAEVLVTHLDSQVEAIDFLSDNCLGKLVTLTTLDDEPEGTGIICAHPGGGAPEPTWVIYSLNKEKLVWCTRYCFELVALADME